MTGSAALVLVALAHAGPVAEDHPSHAYHYQAEPVSVGAVTATTPSAWARQGELKVKVAIDNDTTDFVLLRKDGFEVTTGGNVFSPPPKDDKYDVVGPNDDGAHTFAITDAGGGLHHREMKGRITGAFLVPADGKAVPPVQTTLPVKSQRMEAGPFECVLKGKVKQETDITAAKYACTYRGKQGTVGLVSSSALQVAIPDGTRFGNEDRSKPDVLLPGETTSVKVSVSVIQPRPHGVDMQHTELTVHWDEVFRTSVMKPLAFPELAFTLDEPLTADKNR